MVLFCLEFVSVKEKAMLHWKRLITLGIAAFAAVALLSACNLNSDDGPSGGDETPLVTATSLASGKPSVQIVAPQNNAEFVVNDAVLISVSVTNAVGLTQVRLSVNGQVVQTKSPEAGNTDSTKSFLMDYTPRAAGLVELTVEAYRGTVVSDPAEVTLNIRTNNNQVTATSRPGGGIPNIDPNDPTCRALLQTGLNLRRGPSTNFGVITTLASGSLVPVIGRLGDNSWYQVSSGATVGWVSGSTQFITLYGNRCTSVPVIAQPTNTPVPALPTTAPTLTPFPTQAPQPTLVPPPAQPNLSVSNIAGPETVTIPTGQTSTTVTYGVTITNVGGAITSQFSNQVMLLPGNQTFDAGVVANLGANQSINLNVNVTFTASGTYIVQFQSDSGRQTGESNEVDNNSTLNVTVTGSSSGGPPGSP